MQIFVIDGTEAMLEVTATDLVRRGGEQGRLMLVRILSGKGGQVSISCDGSTVAPREIEPGGTAEFLVPESGIVSLDFVDGIEKIERHLELAPPQRREFRLLMFSHVDLGYTSPIEEVKRLQARYTKEAIGFYKKSRTLSPESRFRWNIETTWALECFNELSNREEKSFLLELLREKEFGLGALYLHHYTDRTTFAELYHALKKTESLEKEGVRTKSAFLSDVPGASTGLLELLAFYGVENLFLSINNFLAPFKVYTTIKSPFWWRLPGGGKILSWYTSDPKWAYIEGYKFFDGDIKKLESQILAKCEELHDERYEYVTYAIPMAIDNREPLYKPVELVESWNERWRNPSITTSTVDGFFEALREELKNTDEATGEFNGWWTSNVLAYPRENAMSLLLAGRLNEAALLDSLRDGLTKEEIEALYTKLAGFNEHSGGGGLYLSKDPQEILTAVTQGYGWIYEANRDSERLLKRLRESEFGIGQDIVVFNSTHIERNDICHLKREEAGEDTVDIVNTETNMTVPSIVCDDSIYFLPGRLDAYEYRVFRPEKVEGRKSESEWSVGPIELKNEFFTIGFDEYGSIVSFVDRESGIDIVAREGRIGRLIIVRQPLNPSADLANAPSHDELYSGKGSPGREEDYLPLPCKWRLRGSEFGMVAEFEPLDIYCSPFTKTYILPKTLRQLVLKIRFKYISDVGPSDFIFLETSINSEKPEIRYSTCGRISAIKEMLSGSCGDALAFLYALKVRDDNIDLNIGLENVNLVDFGSPSPLGFKRKLDQSGDLYFRLFSSNLQNRFASPYLNGEPLDFSITLSLEGESLSNRAILQRVPLVTFEGAPKESSGKVFELMASDNVEIVFDGRASDGRIVALCKELEGRPGEVTVPGRISYGLSPFELKKVKL